MLILPLTRHSPYTVEKQLDESHQIARQSTLRRIKRNYSADLDDPEGEYLEPRVPPPHDRGFIPPDRSSMRPSLS